MLKTKKIAPPYLCRFIHFVSVGSQVCAQLGLTLPDPVDYLAHQAPLFMGLPRQEYCSGLLLPPPGDLPDREIKPLSPSLAGRFFTSEPLGKPFKCRAGIQMSSCLLPKFSTTLLSRRHTLSFRKLSY